MGNKKLTVLETILAQKIAKTKSKKIYQMNYVSCRHENEKLLGEIGATRLYECDGCGLVTGIAK